MGRRIEYIANYFGVEKQTVKAIEEMSELTKELCKYQIGKGDREHIIEEIADVEIMLSQVRHLLNINSEEVIKVKDYKKRRTINYIAKMKEVQ